MINPENAVQLARAIRRGIAQAKGERMIPSVFVEFAGHNSLIQLWLCCQCFDKSGQPPEGAEAMELPEEPKRNGGAYRHIRCDHCNKPLGVLQEAEQ